MYNINCCSQVTKYASIISALGADTIAAIANAGPEMKVTNSVLLSNLKYINYKKQCRSSSFYDYFLPDSEGTCPPWPPLLGVATKMWKYLFMSDLQVKLLSSLGIEGTLITDGNTPINLFNTANGLIALEGGSTWVPGYIALQSSKEKSDKEL